MLPFTDKMFALSLASTEAQSMINPPPCLTVGQVFFSWKCALFLQTYFIIAAITCFFFYLLHQPKRLTWKATSDLFKCSTANLLSWIIRWERFSTVSCLRWCGYAIEKSITVLRVCRVLPRDLLLSNRSFDSIFLLSLKQFYLKVFSKIQTLSHRFPKGTCNTSARSHKIN